MFITVRSSLDSSRRLLFILGHLHGQSNTVNSVLSLCRENAGCNNSNVKFYPCLVLKVEKNVYSNSLNSSQRIESARVRVEHRRKPVRKKMGSLACRNTAHAVAYLRVEAWSVAAQPQFVQVFKRAFRAFPPRSGRLALCLSPPSDLEPRESAKRERPVNNGGSR